MRRETISQDRHRNFLWENQFIKLWLFPSSFSVDLEERIGEFALCRCSYDLASDVDMVPPFCIQKCV